MSEQNLNVIAEQADIIDNLIACLDLSMPAELHIEQLKKILPEISSKIKEVFIAETGENPWE